MRSVLPAFLASMALAWPALADDQAPPSSMAEQGMAMFDSGKLLATGGADKTIILWDAKTGGKQRAQ